MEPTQRGGMIYMTVAIVGYGLVPIFGKAILDAGFPPIDLAVWRYGLSVPVIWLLIYIRNAMQPANAAHNEALPRGYLMAMGVIISASTVMTFWSLERIDASTFIVLFFSFPAMVALLSLLLGERLALREWVALALTALGIVLTTPDFFSGLAGVNLWGVFWALASAFSVAVYFHINPRVLRGKNDVQRASAWALVGAFVPLAIIAVVNGLDTPSGASLWGNLIGLGVLSTSVAVFSLMVAIHKLGAARTSILSTVELPLTVMLAVVLFGERMAAVQALGGLLILVSVVLLNLPEGWTWRRVARRNISAETLEV